MRFQMESWLNRHLNTEAKLMSFSIGGWIDAFSMIIGLVFALRSRIYHLFTPEAELTSFYFKRRRGLPDRWQIDGFTVVTKQRSDMRLSASLHRGWAPGQRLIE
jgi:hypothetical protein